MYVGLSHLPLDIGCERASTKVRDLEDRFKTSKLVNFSANERVTGIRAYPSSLRNAIKRRNGRLVSRRQDS